MSSKRISNDVKVLGLIPARGGSKGVPRKNVRLVLGKPLIAYTIEPALQSQALYRVVVSTDDEEIAAVAREYGAEVPFLRPAELAADTAPMVPVVQHAVRFVEERDRVRPDYVCLLQPTEPFRTCEDIERCIDLIQETSADSVISVRQVFAVHPILMKKIVDGWLTHYCIEEQEGTRRQDYDPPAYMRNGAIYLTRRDVIVERGSLWGDRICPYVMPRERSVGVDDEIDLKLVEFLMAERVRRDLEGS